MSDVWETAETEWDEKKGPGRPISFSVSGEQIVEILADNPNGLRKAELLAAIEALTGDKLEDSPFSTAMRFARDYARGQGFSIPVPRKGNDFVWALTYDQREIRRSAITHGRASATHLETSVEMFCDVLISRHKASTPIGGMARLLRSQSVNMAEQVRILIQMAEADV